MKGLLLVFALCVTLGFRAQTPVPPVVDFKAENMTNQVKVSWRVLQSSYSVNGAQLQWTLDSVFAGFTVLQTYGTFGNPSSDETYEFYHTAPDFNKKNYYRLYLPPGYYSAVSVVDFSTGSLGYKIYPNPFLDVARLEFSNDANREFVLEIADVTGVMLYHIEGITANYIQLYNSWFPRPGLYYFRLYPADGSKLIKGKFAICR